jgi:hypothetical protein
MTAHSIRTYFSEEAYGWIRKRARAVRDRMPHKREPYDSVVVRAALPVARNHPEEWDAAILADAERETSL